MHSAQLYLCSYLTDPSACAYFHIFQKYLYCVWTRDMLNFHLPFSAVLMENVLMQGDLTLEASHFPPWLCQVNSLIKKWNNIMKTVIVKWVCCKHISYFASGAFQAKQTWMQLFKMNPFQFGLHQLFLQWTTEKEGWGICIVFHLALSSLFVHVETLSLIEGYEKKSESKKKTKNCLSSVSI